MRILLIALSACFMMLSAGTSQASEKDFFHKIKGKWSGAGEIVAGKYKGTKFVCTFGGENPEKLLGMIIDGSCRVGVFSQPMNAKIVKNPSGYGGAFLDGEEGDGMDVTGARYTRDRMVVNIKRNNLDSILVANLKDPNVLKISISVKHNKRLIPVIGMSLARKSGFKLAGATQ